MSQFLEQNGIQTEQKHHRLAHLNDALIPDFLEPLSRIAAAQGDEPLPMDLPTESTTTRPLEERERWLTRFRLYLALVQHEPSVLCQCMNGNAEKIVACNKTLHAAAENALWFVNGSEKL